MLLNSLSRPIFLCFALLWLACQPKTARVIRALMPEEVVLLERQKLNIEGRHCDELEGYRPDVYQSPIRYIRVNFHFTNCADSSANYSYKTGTHFARDIIAYANKGMEQNHKMNLPIGNDTPAYPIPYRYVLSTNGEVPGDEGIYFHYNDDLYYFIHEGKNRNSTNKQVIKEYCVNPDSVLNVFVMPHHPDSVKSKTYNGIQTGIALGSSIKISGIIEDKTYQPWTYQGLLNHEIGHVLGIHHTWNSNDGCDDTPKNPNCWNRTKNGSACDSLNSNNVMDYNFDQNAWTPCQLSKIYSNFAQIGSSQRKLLIPNWCQLDTTQNIVIQDSVHWSVARDLSGHVTIEKGGVLKISCRTSFARDAQITVMPGGELILNNALLHSDCGSRWAGIKIVESRKNETIGKVTFLGQPKIQNTEFDWNALGKQRED